MYLDELDVFPDECSSVLVKIVAPCKRPLPRIHLELKHLDFGVAFRRHVDRVMSSTHSNLHEWVELITDRIADELVLAVSHGVAHVDRHGGVGLPI